MEALLRADLDVKRRRIADGELLNEHWNTTHLHAEHLLAIVLERQGRGDEAVEVMWTYVYDGYGFSTNDVGFLVDLLARHGQEARLPALIAGPHGEIAAFRWADLLEQQGRVDEAVAGRLDEAVDVLWPLRRTYAANDLAELLIRQGRVQDAIAVLNDRPEIPRYEEPDF